MKVRRIPSDPYFGELASVQKWGKNFYWEIRGFNVNGIAEGTEDAVDEMMYAVEAYQENPSKIEIEIEKERVLLESLTYQRDQCENKIAELQKQLSDPNEGVLEKELLEQERSCQRWARMSYNGGFQAVSFRVYKDIDGDGDIEVQPVYWPKRTKRFVTSVPPSATRPE